MLFAVLTLSFVTMETRVFLSIYSDKQPFLKERHYWRISPEEAFQVDTVVISLVAMNNRMLKRSLVFNWVH